MNNGALQIDPFQRVMSDGKRKLELTPARHRLQHSTLSAAGCSACQVTLVAGRGLRSLRLD